MSNNNTIPNQNNIQELYLNNVKYKYKNKELKVILNEYSLLSIIDIIHIMNIYEIDLIYFTNISNLHQLENLLKTVRNINFNGNMIIDLISSNMITGLENRSRIDFSALPNNVKLIGFNENNEQTEFTTWAHNLSDDKKKILYSVLTPEQQIIYLKQENAINNIVNDIDTNIPNIYKYSKYEQFKLINDYINSNYSYDSGCINTSRRIILGSEWALDPLETYRRGRGVSSGKANLLLLATNNPYFRLNCTLAKGTLKNSPHTWNQFINEEGNIIDFDMTNNIKENSEEEMKEKGYKYNKVYPIILEKNRKKEKKLKNIPNKQEKE